MIQAAGAMLFSNFLGRSASMFENAYGIFDGIKKGHWGGYKQALQGITGGQDNTVIGSLSELAVDCATMAIPMPLQIGLNLFRGATEFFLGKDSMDACMYAAQGLSGGDFKGFASKVMEEGKDVKKVWLQCKGTSEGMLGHLGSRAGHYYGTVSQKAAPYLNIFFDAAKRSMSLLRR